VWTSLLGTALAMLVALPAAYAVSREAWARRWVGPLVDVPLAAPPLVIGVCLLLLFRGPLRGLDDRLGVSLDWPAVVLAQCVMATCLATRLLASVFDRVPTDVEAVARSLGATPWRAFTGAVLPACRPGVVAAGLLAWSRAFGEFGPVLVFAGVTRGRTEVLSTSIHLELSGGRLGRAAALSLLMLLTAAAVSAAVTRRLTDAGRRPAA
jgi:molybdate transport system permease protein